MWQPIETLADDDVVLLRLPDDSVTVGCRESRNPRVVGNLTNYNDIIEAYLNDYRFYEVKPAPTHWQPFPSGDID